MRIRTEIVTKTDRIIMMNGRASLTAWCPVCSESSRLITPEQAAIITQTDARSIYRLIETAYAEQTERASERDGAHLWVETKTFHFFETTEGLLFVCLNSLQ
ncbi:MAG TPA: hypothetical protein VF131_11670 [Blastocatellia bacterium]|nr:hypothetical protein [Blastocatellia bacterium]